MKFESREELKEYVLTKGCFDEAENFRIYEKFFRESIRWIKHLDSLLNLEGQKVIDVGCSYGHFLINFPQGALGVEIQPRMIRFARNLGLNVIAANVEHDIPVPDLDFDVIHCNFVLEHMVAPHKLCLELYRILKPHGKLIVAVDNMDALGSKGWKAVEHLYAFDKKSLSFLLERSGFKVSQYVVGNPTLSKFARRMIFKEPVFKFTHCLNVITEKIPGFSYPEKRLEIFSPSWMKRNP